VLAVELYAGQALLDDTILFAREQGADYS
jgi:hypothetical protein